MSTRLPDAYFDKMYAHADDPWDLSKRWYEQRKYSITMSLLPNPRYLHAFEPGCSIGMVTQLLTQRCDHVTSVDVADAALATADARLRAAGCRDQVTLGKASLDDPWPAGPFDLVVLSEMAYYLSAELLGEVLRRESVRWAPGATVVAAHWRHEVDDYPLSGDQAHDVIAATPGLTRLGRYRDTDVVIDVFDTAGAVSVAAREGVPGST
ncbi:MAG: SAM-dependent methyltransferase [Mycobacterium sp.]